MIKLPDVLPQPVKPKGLPDNIKWLAGEGAGSWFYIEVLPGSQIEFRISRFSPIGRLECEGIFMGSKNFRADKEFIVTYPSHCQKVTVIQGKKLLTFNKNEK